VASRGPGTSRKAAENRRRIPNNLVRIHGRSRALDIFRGLVAYHPLIYQRWTARSSIRSRGRRETCAKTGQYKSCRPAVRSSDIQIHAPGRAERGHRLPSSIVSRSLTKRFGSSGEMKRKYYSRIRPVRHCIQLARRAVGNVLHSFAWQRWLGTCQSADSHQAVAEQTASPNFANQCVCRYARRSEKVNPNIVAGRRTNPQVVWPQMIFSGCRCSNNR